MSRRRPWRAIAWRTDWTSPTGTAPVGRVAACSEEGLARWVAAHREAGDHVQVYEAAPLFVEVGVTVPDHALAG